MMFNLQVFLSAFALSVAQIAGIGPQNAFVIRQGIARSHVLPIVVICVLCDVFLIGLGVFGMGRVVSGIPGFVEAMAWGGAAFVSWLGLRSLYAAWRNRGGMSAGDAQNDRRRVIRDILVVTFVNPYAWLDTVVLIGGVSAVYGAETNTSFLLGSLTASALWFGAVGFGAGKLAPLFERPASWRVLDGVIGVVMLLTAASLLINFGLGSQSVV